MQIIEHKLAEWHKLYKELEAARQRLASAPALPAERRLAFEVEVRELQRVSDDALAAVQAQLASQRAVRGPSRPAVMRDDAPSSHACGRPPEGAQISWGGPALT